MKELQDLRNEILTLRNYGVINKEEEKSLLNKLNTIKEQLRIGIVVGQSEQYCECKYEPSCRRQDNKLLCNDCNKEVK
jgi:hypothetical protein